MNMTAQEHYQWVGYRNAKYFPDTNWPTACRNVRMYDVFIPKKTALKHV